MADIIILGILALVVFLVLRYKWKVSKNQEGCCNCGCNGTACKNCGSTSKGTAEKDRLKGK